MLAARQMRDFDLPRFPGRVLDAGCGTGGYAIALAEHADSVVAVDYTAERVKFLDVVLSRLEPRPDIETAVGSVEAMPYPDSEFDGIYCRSVIFITHLPSTLAEFHRVLRPGGQVYIDCNADGWSSYLVLERGRTNPDVARQGRDTLYNTVWRRLSGPALPLLRKSIEERGLRVEVTRAGVGVEVLLNEMDRHLRVMTSTDAATVRRLELQARTACGEEHLATILADMLATAGGNRSGPSTTVSSAAWQPEEVAEVARSLGFVDFSWWSEAGSRAMPGLRPLEIGPQIETDHSARRHFRGSLTVWHALFRKAEPGR